MGVRCRIDEVCNGDDEGHGDRIDNDELMKRRRRRMRRRMVMMIN